MLPAEGCKNHVAEPGKGLPPAVTVAPQSESLRMERGHGKLDFCSLASVLGSFQSNRVVRHGAGILAAVGMRPAAGRSGIDARGRQAYDPPRSPDRPAVRAPGKGFRRKTGAAALIPASLETSES
jgi:hypothetical protein